MKGGKKMTDSQIQTDRQTDRQRKKGRQTERQAEVNEKEKKEVGG